MYEIYVRDQYFNRVAEVTDYQQLDLIPKFNSPGSWVLDIPTDCEAAKELIKPKAGIIVKRNGKTILSGPRTQPKRRWDSNGDQLTISGYDDLVHLQRNYASPVPHGPPYTSQAYDIRTGKAETVMKAYLTDNIGINGRSERKINNLLVEVDKGLGNTVTGRARFHNFIELFTSLALSGGDLGFRVVQVGKNLEFQVYTPSDKTNEVFFSPLLGNLSEFEYTVDDPECNYVIVGGGGEGTDRILLEKGNNTSIAKYGRIESFVDRRDTTDIKELEQAMNEELTQKAEKTSLSISPIDTESIAFGRDYNLGDKVSVLITQPNEVVDIETLHYFISAYQTIPVDVERVRRIQEKLEVIKDVVREIKITITPNGENISPVIGTPDSLAHPLLGIFDKMKKITRRINNLERR
ncbi:siphovirus ReqiPepy6 Gp37-like family protein [Metabacillus halosaccharovorans]|uniref:siphovirus ReqiPepy6 Gp37-like family protein n=1 Tax=Metabacillus halosaccharovorans TaxID=930124 RepID=UPI0034CFF5F1